MRNPNENQKNLKYENKTLKIGNRMKIHTVKQNLTKVKISKINSYKAKQIQRK